MNMAKIATINNTNRINTAPRTSAPNKANIVKNQNIGGSVSKNVSVKANPNRLQNEKVGINSGTQKRFVLNNTANKTLIADARNVPPTQTDKKVGNVGDISGYGTSKIKVNQNGKTNEISVNDIVTKGVGKNQILSGPQNVKINGSNLYLDYHGTKPVRLTYSPTPGSKPVSGVIVKNGSNYEFVKDKPLRTLGVQTQITNPASKPWREQGIPDWRQKQLQSVANDYINKQIPLTPGGNSANRRTEVNPKTDTNIASGNDGRKHPVLNYKDVGSIFAGISKDQRLTDNEKFEVSRLVSEGYGKRQNGAGSINNTILGRKYLLSSQYSRPENADSGVHTAFLFGGRPFHEDDHGTHIVNGANYADNRHSGWIQSDLNKGINDNTIINNFRNRATREETVPITNRVNTGDVNSSVNATRALLAGYRQSQTSEGKSGYAAFAIQWIKGAVSEKEGEQIIRDFKLRDELNKR
jgi:hypothetical protein